MAKKHKYAISFSGPPGNLTADVSMPRVSGHEPTVKLQAGPLSLLAFGDDKNINKLVLIMPGDTPPGVIETRVDVGDYSYDAVIDVQQRSALVFEPAALTLRASAGDTVSTTLHVTNLGNATLSFDADSEVTLRPSGALGRSIAKEFKQKRSDLADRLIEIGKDLAKSESHQLSVDASMQPTTLDTGQSSTVALELGVPDTLLPETRWTGNIALLGERVRVEVETTAV